MTRKRTVATAPGAECLHPENLAFNREREDGSGRWDRICGVVGCGFVMCEIGKPAAASGVDSRTGEMCTHPPFTRNWRVVEAELEALMCDCGTELERRAAPGKFPVVQDGDAETEAAVQAAEASFTQGGDNAGTSAEAEAAGVEADAGRAGDVAGGGVAEPVAVTAGDGAVTSPFSSDTSAEAMTYAEANAAVVEEYVEAGLEVLVEEEETREAFVPEEKSTSYVTREPHKISPRFQEPLPVTVDQTILAQHGMELAQKHHLWLDTKLKAKAFAKSCKEVTDKCEREMIELGEIIQAGAEIRPVDCQWEYDFTEGVKRLRRCDSWTIVKEETLTVEERQLSLDLTSSTSAVEKLRQIQQEMAGGAVEDTPLTDDAREEETEDLEQLQALLALVGLDVPLEVLSQQSPEDLQAAKDYSAALHLHDSDNEDVVVPPLPSFIQLYYTAMTAGEVVGNGYPLDPDQVGEELQAVQEQANPEEGLDSETIAERDAFCQGWRECTEVKLCMGPENTTGQCYHIVQEQEEDRDHGDPLGAALAEED